MGGSRQPRSRKAGVMLSAFTSRLDDAGTPHADPPALRLPVGRNAHRSPLLRSTGASQFQDALDASRFLVTDALRRLSPSVMVPRFGPTGGLAMLVSPSIGPFERVSECLRARTASKAGVMFGKGDQRRERSGVYFATAFAGGAQQRCTSRAEGAVLPAGFLSARLPLLVLQDPLQRIVDDPPARVELGYVTGSNPLRRAN